jgi:hypothetical protein
MDEIFGPTLRGKGGGAAALSIIPTERGRRATAPLFNSLIL